MKRFLSIILALAMITALIPAAFATGETEIEGVTIEYSFAGNYGDDPCTAINYSSTKGRIAYEDTDSIKISNSNYNGGLAYFDIRVGNYVAFKIRVPVEGEYEVKFDVRDGTSCNKLTVDMYILPGNTDDIANSLKTETPLIADICKTSGTYSYSTNKELDAGEYIIAFKRTGFVDGGSATEHNFRPKLLTLDGGDGRALIYADMSISDEDGVLDAGTDETATVSFGNVYMSDGVAATDEEISKIEIISTKKAVATVSGTTITAEGVGTTTIQAKVGDYLLAEKEITVTNSKLSGVKVTYETGNSTNSPALNTYTYSTTNGRLEYFGTTSTNSTKFGFEKFGSGGYEVSEATGKLRFIGQLFMGKDQWTAYKIRIPAAGDYTAALIYGKSTSSPAVGSMYILPIETTDISAAFETATPVFIDIDFYSATPELGNASSSFYAPKAGEYYMVWTRTGGNGSVIRPARLTLDGGNTKTPLIYADISLGEDALEVGETTALTLNNAYLSNGTTDNETTGITYTSTKETVATIVNGTVTAIGEGTAKIQAKSGDYVLGEVAVTVTAPVVVPEESEITDKNVSVYIVSEDETKGTVTTNLENAIDEVEIGTAVEATATPAEGYTFAYWKNGAGTVLSSSAKESFTLNTNTAIYAVFEAVASENETQVPVYFYNGNGEPIVTKNATKGETTFGALKAGVTATLTGYAFKHWSDKDENIAIADELVINALTRAVAIFEDTGLTYTVKNGDKVITSSAKYGEEVTVTSDATDFSYWKLGNKIMSYDKAYKFNVYGNITLTEVTGETVTAAPTIVLDNIGGNYFLTYDANGNTLIEAGILFGLENRGKPNVGSYNAKAIAKRGTGQFTAKPSEEDEPVARGYMMFRDSTGAIKVIYAD